MDSGNGHLVIVDRPKYARVLMIFGILTETNVTQQGSNIITQITQ